MSGEPGASKKSGKGRNRRRGRGRGRGNEPQQGESRPGEPQQPREEAGGATAALPVSQPAQAEHEQVGAEQASGGLQAQQRAQTPKKHRQRKKHGSEQHGEGAQESQPPSGRQHESQQSQPIQQPKFGEPKVAVEPKTTQQPKSPEQPISPQQPKMQQPKFSQQPKHEQPKSAPPPTLQQQSSSLLESPQAAAPQLVSKQPQKKQPSKKQDRTDGGFPSKPAEGQPKAAPVATPQTPKAQPSKTAPPSQPSGKQQRQAAQAQAPIQQQPTGPPRSEKGEIRPPLRPDGGGKAGRPIRLRVNFLPVKLPTNDIHHYDTDIKAKGKKSGEGYTKSEASKIIHAIVQQYEAENPHGPKLVYDKDGKNVYCRTPIPGIEKDKREFNITFTTDNGREREYIVTIQWASKVSLYNLNEALEGRMTEIPRDTLQAVQTVLRFLPSMTSIPVGASFFSFPDGHEKDLGLGLQIWNGRFVSIRPTQWKMMLNVDITATAFYKAQPVLHFMCDCLELDQIPARLNKGQANLFWNEMKDIKIETTHVKRKQRVCDLSVKSARDERFPLGDGTMVSVFEYFKSQHGITLKYPDLPCLVIGQKRNLLPIEVCNIVEGQRKRREERLTAEQMRNMIRHTAIPAPQRLQEIEKVIRNSKFDEDPYCQDFGIKVGKEMASIKGRVLEPPMLSYGPADQPRKEKPRDGVWDMKQKPMYEPKELNEWAIVSYENPRFLDERAIDTFINKLVTAGKEKQLRIHPSPCRQAIQRGHEGIGQLFAQLHNDYPNLQLIIVIFPGKGSTDEYYKKVKRYGDIVYGIRTQCLKSNTATRKADPQTMANICLKINAKLGGTTSIIEKGIRSPILKRPVIIFGADVTHPSPRDVTTPSIAAVVASMDAHPNIYSAEVRVQKHRQEMIAELKEMVVILLKKFRASTKVAPEKIIFYRDGVSEGQFRDVLIYELQAFQQACRELHPNYKPQITFIVVQKRHHARFFAEDPRDQRGKSKNIPAGTVVDTQVCHPFEFDWYLCSHAGIQGTSKPAHYHVLYDDSDFKSDELQILTNQLCHTYVRCARAVSIPAPAYYAHHVAFRARYHLKKVDRGSNERSLASGSEGVTLQKEEMIRSVKINDKLSSTMYFA